MEFKEYLTDDEKMILCLRCQKCCKSVAISLRHDPESDMYRRVTEHYMAHGCTSMIFGNSLIISIPHICQHLTENGCSIYKNRPLVCREYDGRKDPRMFRSCLWGQVTKQQGMMSSSSSVSERAEVKIT